MSAVAPVETALLAPGYRISRLLKGGWQLAGDHGSVERERAIDDMLAFPAAGITAFDCADIYRGVEEMIGAFRQRLRQERGAEALLAVRIHTKFAPDYDRLPVSRAETRATVERSLSRLRQDRLDLVQFHWWNYAVPGAVETAGWLAELQAEGKIELLGATNFDVPNLKAILDAGIVMKAHQVQYSLLDRRPEHGMLDLMAAHGLQLLAYGSLAGGFLTDGWLGRPDPGHAFANRSLVKYRLVIDELGGWDAFQELLRLLRRIADRHGVSLANVATRWVLDRPGVAGAIVGARYADHLPENLAVFGFALDAADNAALDAFLAAHPGPPGDTFGLERDKSGRHGRIMKYNLNTGSDRIG